MQFNVAIVHDALPFYGGAERTLAALLEVYPDAPVFTVMHRPEAFIETPLARADVRPSWLNKMPGIRDNHYRYFPLFPLAIRSFDLRAFDIVISSHYAAAHWVRTEHRQLHVAYVYTPLRHIWQRAEEFTGRFPGPLKLPVRFSQHMLRRLDRASSRRVTRFVACSAWIAGHIRLAYGREADVVYPPVDVERFYHSGENRTGFICVSRLADHKGLEIVVSAFNRLGLPLELIGDGPERRHLQAMAGPNITFSGSLSDEQVALRLAHARAFVHMAPEDFGIAVVEAQAAGCPVIAFSGGANRETILDGTTGLLVPERSVDALQAAIQRFVEMETQFKPDRLRHHAAGFSKERFKQEIQEIIQTAYRRR